MVFLVAAPTKICSCSLIIDTPCEVDRQLTAREEPAMSGQKFDQLDRDRTIMAVQDHFGVTLSRVGSRPKYLVDEAGIPYLVLGGYDDWHGIPKDIFADARQRPAGKLIVAKRLPSKICVYCGPLSKLVETEHKLSTNAAGDRQFVLGWTNRHPHMKEIRDLHLQLLKEIDYPNEAKEKDRRSKELRKILAALSPEQREVVLKNFGSKPS